MNNEYAITACVLLALLGGLQNSASADVSKPDSTKAISEVAGGNNAFGLDLYHELAARQGNMFFSPYSIDSAMAMVYAGARGNTASEIAAALHLPDLGQTNAGFSALNARLMEAGANKEGKSGEGAPYTLSIANALFGQQGYPFVPDYLALLKSDYSAVLEPVDFSHAPVDAAKSINSWVAHQTHDKITEIVQPKQLDELTRLILVNAVYFKANWVVQFSKSATQDAPFHAAKDVTVPMMHLNHMLPYSESEDFQAVVLPYMGYQAEMLLVVPKKVDGLAAVEKSLTAEMLEKLFVPEASQTVELYLPKFKMTDSIDLKPYLKNLGIKTAFASESDLSGICSGEKLFINDVLHKTYLDVNEEGTEAAAVTAVRVGAMAMRQPQKPVTIRADHPFFFAIYHRDSKTIQFMGRLIDPS